MSILTAQQARSGYGGSTGGVVARTAASSGIVSKSGQPMPASANFLALQAEAERRHKLDRAWRHYNGEMSGHFSPEPGQPDLNVITNRAAPIVDTGVDFLAGPVATLEVLHNGNPDKAAQAALDGCWGKENKRMDTLSKLAQNGGIFGHCFVKILEPRGPGRPYCRLIVLDPSQMTVETDPTDCDTVVCYVQEWTERGPEALSHYSVGRRQVIERVDLDDTTANGNTDDDDAYTYSDDNDADAEDVTWRITNQVRGPNGQWFDVGDPMPWPYPWAPIADWQNMPLANTHWGQSDIPANLQHLNNVINLTYSNVNAIAKHHSFPWLYASGVGMGATLELAPGKITQLQASDAKLAAVEAHGDLSGLLSFSDSLELSMDEQSRVPAVATGRYKDMPPVTSGLALQTTLQPLLAKTTHKQRSYGLGIEDTSLRMLSLCGYGDGTGCDGWEVCVHWGDPLPSDDAALAQMALALNQIGASKHSIYTRLGLEYDQEQDYLEQEAKDAMKAALAGGAMPQPMLPPAPGQPGQPGQQQAGSPQNNPRVQQAQNVMAAAGKAMKGGAR